MRIERREYMDRLRGWRDKQIIKVITGVRRCEMVLLGIENEAEGIADFIAGDFLCPSGQ